MEAEATQFSHPTIKFRGKAVGTGTYRRCTHVFDVHKRQYDDKVAKGKEDDAKKCLRMFFCRDEGI